MIINKNLTVEPKEFEIVKYVIIKDNKEINIKKVMYKNSHITLKEPDNVVLLKNKQLVKIQKITTSSLKNTASKIQIFGKNLEISSDEAFHYPTKASDLDIYVVKNKQKTKNAADDLERFFLSDIKCKMAFLSVFELPSDEKQVYAIPLLHNSDV